MASDRTLDPPPSGDTTPALLRQQGIGNGGLFWQHFGERLVAWARTNLRRANIQDPATAEDVVLRLVAKLQEKWTYDPSKGSLTAYLWQAVRNGVQQELRERQRRPGDYGAAPADADWLKALEDSFSASFGDVDSEWQRRQRAQTRVALKRIRAQVTLLESEVFYLKAVKGLKAPLVARMVNEQFRPAPPLDAAKVYPTVCKVRDIFNEEFRRAGIDPETARPETLADILREELGLTKQPPADRNEPPV